MKLSTLLLAALLCTITPAALAADKDIEAVLRQVSDGFNAGDVAAVKALHVKDPTIVDNVPPFIWSGENSFDIWLGDLVKFEEVQGISDGKVTFAPVVDEVIDGDRAYVATRSIYTFKQKGKDLREDGFTAFVFVKTTEGWKVESWSWASPSAE